MTKTGPSMQRFSRELAATAVPLMVAIVLLGLFTIPNYLRAREWSREASSLRAVANEAAARQDNLLDIQREIERLRAELAQRGRTLPAAPDQGALLGSIARSADAKGVTSSQSKSGKLALISVPGLVGGKAMRRAVDVEMSGSFEALFAAVGGAEQLPRWSPCDRSTWPAIPPPTVAWCRQSWSSMNTSVIAPRSRSLAPRRSTAERRVTDARVEATVA
jgi:Tfp pilus assembly protein PilO